MASLKYLHSSAAFLLCCCIFNIATAKFVIRLRSDSDCPTPGYFRDETDCRKFYRCAEHPTGVPGQNLISRSEYNCPPGTIFDEALSSCNHIMFVQNIPPGCDVSEAMPTTTSSAVTTKPTSSPSSSPPPSSTPTSTPSSSQLPPENLQTVPMLPGADQQNQLMLPAITSPMIPDGENQQQQPMFPSINFPNLPGSQGQQPMFPSINFPMLPGSQGQQPMIPSLPIDGGQEQQPMFPSINFPMLPGSQEQQPMIPSLPGGSGQEQPPMFPSINFPMLPGSQGQQPMIPSVPVGGQQQQSLMPFMPHFNLPAVAGSPQLPQFTLPSSMRIFGMLPSAQHTQQQQNKNQEKKFQNLYPSITITAQNSENKLSNMPGWITPQQFPDESLVVKPEDVSSSGGWVVPDNFPTFYSAFTGSPFLLSSNAFNNPYSLIMV